MRSFKLSGAKLFMYNKDGMNGLAVDEYMCLYFQCPRCNCVGLPVPESTFRREGLNTTTACIVCEDPPVADAPAAADAPAPDAPPAAPKEALGDKRKQSNLETDEPSCEGTPHKMTAVSVEGDPTA